MDWADVEAGRDAEGKRGTERALVHRVLRVGAGLLSELELLALVTGCRDVAVLEAALRDGWRALAAEGPDSLLDRTGLREGAVARLAAAFELTRRLDGAHRDARPRFSTPESIYAWARPLLASAHREEFHALCLSARGVLLRHVRVAQGSVDQCHVDPREVLGPAVASRATGLVLLHNHPGGDPEPSAHDVALTRQLKEAARLLCIKLVDHLVVCERAYVSMAAKGLLGADPRLPLPKLHTS